MKEKVASLETEIALIRNDIRTIYKREPQLPTWLKNSATIVLAAMFTQIMTSVWWAATMTTNLDNMKADVSKNTEFRLEYPKMHAETMIELRGLKKDSEHTRGMVKEIKEKLRFVDIKSQVK